MKRHSTKSTNKGQIGLVVLLIASVLLTLGVGVASQSVTEQRTSRQEYDSTETFNAADEALEYALSQDEDDLASLDGTTYSHDSFTGTISLNTATTSYSRVVRSGESAQVNVNAGGSISIAWDQPVGATCNYSASGTIPGVIVTFIGSTGLTRMAYGPSTCATRGDNFSSVTLSGTTYTASITVPAGRTIARIKPVYNSATLSVSGTGVPDQQFTVTATAKRDSGETRAVEASKTPPALPSIFDYAVFAGTGSIAITP